MKMYGEEKEKIEVRVRVIFQNPNPKMLRPLRFRLSRSDPPEAPPTFVVPQSSREQNRLEKVFQKCYISGKNRNFRGENGTKTGLFPPFRFRLSCSDRHGDYSNVSRFPNVQRTKPSRESFSKVQYFWQK